MTHLFNCQFPDFACMSVRAVSGGAGREEVVSFCFNLLTGRKCAAGNLKGFFFFFYFLFLFFIFYIEGLDLLVERKN